MPSGHSRDLKGFAEVSRKIKSLAYLTGDIELTAINSMLVAQKAGGASIGFGVVALEIQSISQGLNHAVQDLSRLVQQLSTLVGQEMSLARRVRLLSLAAAFGGWGQVLMVNAYDLALEKMRVGATQIRAVAKASVRLLQSAEQQCMQGIALGRAGKIEASYGGAMAERLGQASTEVADRMADFMEILKSLGTDIQVWQA